MTTFAELTTIGVGGPIARFIEPTTRVGVIEAVEEADAKGLPLCVIGGGSNMLVSDTPFPGVVVRDARRAITVPDEAAPVEGGDRTVHINAEAGCNWDDFVAFTVEMGLEGVEGLSGIPGTVGASVVQNIGAYGQEVASSVESVEVWDRKDKRTVALTPDDLQFGYRSSALKSSMYAAPAAPAAEFFPTPRYVVLSVTFALRHSATGTVGYGQLAKALGVQVGDRMETRAIRNAVLKVRASKGMLEDAARYLNPAMEGTKRADQVRIALRAQYGDDPERAVQDHPDHDRHSCGSFFMNPILTAEQAARLPEDAPRFDAALCQDLRRLADRPRGLPQGVQDRRGRQGGPVHHAHARLDQPRRRAGIGRGRPRPSRTGRRRGRVRRASGPRTSAPNQWSSAWTCANDTDSDLS